MSSEKTRILEALCELVGTTFSTDASRLSGETTAMDVDGWDSVSHVKFILNVENHFDIRFNIVDVLKVQNLNELAELISKM